MAYMYPVEENFDYHGEATMYEVLRDYLPDGYICYFNRKVGLLEFDFAVLAPGRGIVIIEVKGYHAKDIKSVKNDYIYLTKGEPVFSPFKQADKYRFAFDAILKAEIDKNIPIFAMACYPFISEDEYKQKELHLISGRDNTILTEDLNSSIISRIETLLIKGRKETQKQFSELTLNIIGKIRKIFEPQEVIDSSESSNDLKVEWRPRGCYSVFTVLKAQELDDQVKQECIRLLNHWKSGTKICIVTIADGIREYIVDKFNSYIKSLDSVSYDRFSLYKENGDIKYTTFNFEIYLVTDELPECKIIDGVYNDVEFKVLKAVDSVTSFNINQYMLEHAKIDSDIMVTAGAGTGKTTCMISRISYLVYKHQLTSETLPDALFMLTFTNEAANNMKRRLQSYFQDYFLLTMDYEALQLAECIENMRISTIHSLCKKILEHYAVKLALGKNLSIVSGKYEKDAMIAQAVNDYIEANCSSSDPSKLFNMPMYEMQSRISDLMTKFQNKNVDIVNDDLNFGNFISSKQIHDAIKNIPMVAEKQIRKYFDDLSSVRLSDLMIKLKELVTCFGQELSEENYPIKYLFVDEFQDTDDVQINLMKKFRDVFGFNFFVVGDVKQCIYRFRGADEKAFDTLAPMKDKWELYSLNKNYRTDKNLLTAFDKRFSTWGEHKLLDYKENDVLVGVKDYGNTGAETSYYYKDNTWSTSSDKDKRFVKLLERLIEEVREQNGEQVAVLVRENWQVEYIKNLCKENNIYIETDVGGDLYKIQPAIDLYKLVKALQHYKNPKYLFNLYTTYYVDSPMPKEQIFEQKQFTEGLLALFNMKSCPIKNWSGYVQSLKYEPVLKILREIVMATKPWKNYASKEPFPEYSEKLESFYHHNLDEIFEKLAFEFNSDYLTISKVEKYLEIMILTKQQEQSRESMVDESRALVVCSTIHKAKGLEYYAVMLPFMASALGSTRYKGYSDLIIIGKDVGYSVRDSENVQVENDIYRSFKQNEANYRRDEEARILYVAMTRAKKRFIYFDDKKNSGTVEAPKNWQALLRGET